jgi:hypothetical protein
LKSADKDVITVLAHKEIYMRPKLKKLLDKIYTLLTIEEIKELGDEMTVLHKVAEKAVESVDCCNVYGKKCGVEDLRKAVKEYQQQQYQPWYHP